MPPKNGNCFFLWLCGLVVGSKAGNKSPTCPLKSSFLNYSSRLGKDGFNEDKGLPMIVVAS
jgi:hypothetical protein